MATCATLAATIRLINRFLSRHRPAGNDNERYGHMKQRVHVRAVLIGREWLV